MLEYLTTNVLFIALGMFLGFALPEAATLVLNSFVTLIFSTALVGNYCFDNFCCPIKDKLEDLITKLKPFPAVDRIDPNFELYFQASFDLPRDKTARAHIDLWLKDLDLLEQRVSAEQRHRLHQHHIDCYHRYCQRYVNMLQEDDLGSPIDISIVVQAREHFYAKFEAVRQATNTYLQYIETCQAFDYRAVDQHEALIEQMGKIHRKTPSKALLEAEHHVLLSITVAYAKDKNITPEHQALLNRIVEALAS